MRTLGYAASILLGTVLLATGQTNHYGLRRLDAPPLEIPGAKVATENQARMIAFEAFLRPGKGISATESAQIDSIVTLGFDLEGFGRRGDKIWQASIREITTSGLTAIIWVHSGSGATRILISR